MRRWAPFVVLGILTLVLAGFAVVEVGEHRELSSRAELQDDAVTLAREQVEGLITVDRDSVDRLEDLEDDMTGEFLTQFRGMVDTFRSVVTQGEVSSEGTVVAAGAEEIGAERAVVLVAASSQVASTSSKGEQVERNYRFRVTLERADGRWLVASMGFVG